MHPALLPDLVVGLDRCLQYYTSKAKSDCGSRNTFIPSMPALTRCTTETKFHGVFKKKEKPANLQRRNSQVATMNGNNITCKYSATHRSTTAMCTYKYSATHLYRAGSFREENFIILLRYSESAHAEDFSNGLGKKFELTPAACLEGIQQVCEATAYKIVFHDLSHSLWDGLYVGEPSSSTIEPFLQELEQNLMIIADTVHEIVRTHLVAEIMKASFEGFLLVLLAGVPSRSFTRQDSQIIEDDFKSHKDLFCANGDGQVSNYSERCYSTSANRYRDHY